MNRTRSTAIPKLLSIMLALCCSVAVGADVVRYDGFKAVRLEVTTAAQLDAIEAAGGIVANCNPAPGEVVVYIPPDRLGQLEALQVPLRIMHENVQDLITPLVAAPARGDAFDDFFLDYHVYGDGDPPIVGSIVWYMEELVSRYPTLASVVEIGTTLEGRIIKGLRISNDAVPDKPAVVYFGAEHGREWISTTVPTYLATQLLQEYGDHLLITELVDNVEFFLIPVFNVDGYEYTMTDRLWRKNRRNNGDGTYGVDINRNWGEGWGGPGSSSDPSDSGYRGTAPFSEPETQALRDFFLAHPNVRAQLDIHSYGQYVFWPFGSTVAPSADQYAYLDLGTAMQSSIEAVHGMHYKIGPLYLTLVPASGNSMDWTYAQLDIMSYSFECRDTGTFNFLLPPDQIIPNNEELVRAMLFVADSDWVRSPMRYRFRDGLPSAIQAGVDTAIQVEVIGQSETVVPESAALYYRYDDTAPYEEVAMTPMGDESFEAVLPATNCTSNAEFHFSAVGDAGSLVTSPSNAPTARHQASLGNEPFFFEDMSNDPGWTVEGQWAWGQPTGGGGVDAGPDPTEGYTGNTVYGYNLTGDYASDLSETHLTTGAIDCTGETGVHLTFWRWLGVEKFNFDHAFVRVSTDGSTWTRVWKNPGHPSLVGGAWTFQEIDIATIADNQPTVYLRWTMGATNDFWEACGWNIDDVGLYPAGDCVSLMGDFNGDGAVNTLDYDEFVLCFSGPTQPPPPGCDIFDSDLDDDVDCSDWAAFVIAWTDPGDPPAFGECGIGAIPAVSEWGVVAMTLLLLATGTLVWRRLPLAGHREGRSAEFIS